MTCVRTETRTPPLPNTSASRSPSSRFISSTRLRPTQTRPSQTGAALAGRPPAPPPPQAPLQPAKAQSLLSRPPQTPLHRAAPARGSSRPWLRHTQTRPPQTGAALAGRLLLSPQAPPPLQPAKAQSLLSRPPQTPLRRAAPARGSSRPRLRRKQTRSQTAVAFEGVARGPPRPQRGCNAAQWRPRAPAWLARRCARRTRSLLDRANTPPPTRDDHRGSTRIGSEEALFHGHE